MGVEEEQLVAAARLADGPANRETVVPLLQYGLGIAVQDVRSAVAVPARIALDIIQRPVETVRAALGDRCDLHAGGPAELRLVTSREHPHLRERLRVQAEHDRVVPRAARRDAVHDDVAVATAAHTGHAGTGAVDSRREGRQAGEVPIDDRQGLDRRRVDAERPLTARGLNQGRSRRDVHHFALAADLQRQRPDDHPGIGTDLQAPLLQDPERWHLDLQRVGVRRDVRQHEIAGSVRHHGCDPGAACLADQHDCRAGQHAALRVLHRAQHGSRHLRRRRNGPDTGQDQDHDHSQHCVRRPTPVHEASPGVSHPISSGPRFTEARSSYCPPRPRPAERGSTPCRSASAHQSCCIARARSWCFPATLIASAGSLRRSNNCHSSSS